MGGAATKLRTAFWATFALGLVDLALIDLVLAPQLTEEHQGASAPGSLGQPDDAPLTGGRAPRPGSAPVAAAPRVVTAAATSAPASPAPATPAGETSPPTTASAPPPTATKSPPAAPPDRSSAPAAVAPPDLPTIRFATASARLHGRYRTRLLEVARWLREARATLRLRGHSDPRGDEDFNQRLSARRAEAVARFLRTRGVRASQLEKEALGSAEPATAGDTREAWAASRRVELVRAR